MKHIDKLNGGIENGLKELGGKDGRGDEPNSGTGNSSAALEAPKNSNPQRLITMQVDATTWEMVRILRRDHHIRITGVVRPAVQQAIRECFIRENLLRRPQS